MKAKYFTIGKNIEVREFERYKAPLGWVRSDILLQELKEDKVFRDKFSKSELKKIKGLV